MMKLSQDGKEELALALFLWKDFKCQGKVDIDFYKQMLGLADCVGVRAELEALIKKVRVALQDNHGVTEGSHAS